MNSLRSWGLILTLIQVWFDLGDGLGLDGLVCLCDCPFGSSLFLIPTDKVYEMNKVLDARRASFMCGFRVACSWAHGLFSTIVMYSDM